MKEESMESEGKKGRNLSIHTKILLLLAGSLILFALAFSIISINIYTDIPTNSSPIGEVLPKIFLTFLCVFVITLLGTSKLLKQRLVTPIRTMTHTVETFSYDTPEAMEKSLKDFCDLNIRTGDEVENLYRSFVAMTKNSVHHMTDIQQKNETISDLQNALILTLANMVERRDKNTGEHIRKTAAYVEIVAKELKREGAYPAELTEDFIENIITSAPLHDVGKIAVPDAILNKPGKLTDEEFDIIKSHTTVGGRIISSLIAAVPESKYLYEALDLAMYHHEKWNGRGYPAGLAGEDIPLSARIMAVADVFDALVSNRSYKKGFPYEKALSIIQEERGSHFDPKVVDAFFAVKDEILKVADKFSEMEKKEAQA